VVRSLIVGLVIAGAFTLNAEVRVGGVGRTCRRRPLRQRAS